MLEKEEVREATEGFFVLSLFFFPFSFNFGRGSSFYPKKNNSLVGKEIRKCMLS